MDGLKQTGELAEPIEVRAEIDRVAKAGAWIERALFTVAGGALVFTMLNVTLFATAHGTPWWMAWLLDPLASIALLAALVGDGVLSRYGHPCGAWGTALKWFAALATGSMNVWSSVAAGSAAGVVLHSVAPALVVLLAEAAPRYRRRFAAVTAELSARHAALTTPATMSTDAAPVEAASAGSGEPTQPLPRVAPAPSGTPRPSGETASIPAVPRSRPGRRPSTPALGSTSSPARSIEALRAELAAAIEAGDLASPPSAESIRKALRISPARARRLRDEHTTHTPHNATEQAREAEEVAA